MTFSQLWTLSAVAAWTMGASVAHGQSAPPPIDDETLRFVRHLHAPCDNPAFLVKEAIAACNNYRKIGQQGGTTMQEAFVSAAQCMSDLRVRLDSDATKHSYSTCSLLAHGLLMRNVQISTDAHLTLRDGSPLPQANDNDPLVLPSGLQPSRDLVLTVEEAGTTAQVEVNVKYPINEPTQLELAPRLEVRKPDFWQTWWPAAAFGGVGLTSLVLWYVEQKHAKRALGDYENCDIAQGCIGDLREAERAATRSNWGAAASGLFLGAAGLYATVTLAF